MKPFVYYFSALILVLISLLLGGAGSGIPEIPPPAEEIGSEGDENAELSVHFIAGTAFLAAVEAYDSEGSNFRHLGGYGAGGIWKGTLPVYSHLRVRVVALFFEYCWYFDVVRPTTATIHFWGSYFRPHFSLQGDAARLGAITSGYWHCPELDYEPKVY